MIEAATNEIAWEVRPLHEAGGGDRAVQRHQDQVVDRRPAQVAQAGLHLLPERLVDIVGNLAFVLWIHDARHFVGYDRDTPFLARRVGKAHYFVGSSV